MDPDRIRPTDQVYSRGWRVQRWWTPSMALIDAGRGYRRMIPSIRILCGADDARAILLFDVVF